MTDGREPERLRERFYEGASGVRFSRVVQSYTNFDLKLGAMETLGTRSMAAGYSEMSGFPRP